MTWNWLSRPRTLMIALGLSLTLNLCGLGGMGYSHFAGPPLPPLPGHKFDHLPQQLNLTQDQMPAFEEFRRALHQAQEELAKQDRPVQQETWTEMERDTPDTAKIEALVDEMAMHRHAFQVDATAATLRFSAALTPEQRKQLSRVALDRRDPAGGPIRGMGN